MPFFQRQSRLSHNDIPNNNTPDTFGMTAHRVSQQGFTLVEMVVVVVILTIFAGMMAMSVGSTESRKNRAFYEHLQDSLSYIRLLSAEQMQPMGMRLTTGANGESQLQVVALTNPYAHFQVQDANQANLATGGRQDSTAKNNMELSAMTTSTQQQAPTPTWQVQDNVQLPQLPARVTLAVSTVDMTQASQSLNVGMAESGGGQMPLNPWFSTGDVPQVLWFGTGEAAPVRIEVRHNDRLVGDAILVTPDGQVTVERMP